MITDDSEFDVIKPRAPCSVCTRSPGLIGGVTFGVEFGIGKNARPLDGPWICDLCLGPIVGLGLIDTDYHDTEYWQEYRELRA